MVWSADYITDAAGIDPWFGDCSNDTLPKNPNGYFYYHNTETLTDAFLTLKGNPNSPIIIDRPTVLYVVGADAYISQNITYSGNNASLIIIVKEDSA